LELRHLAPLPIALVCRTNEDKEMKEDKSFRGEEKGLRDEIVKAKWSKKKKDVQNAYG
jgi:hypothetical protein